MNAVARARSYLAKLPPAVAGQGKGQGHAQTFAAACRLVEFGLSQEEAWPLLCEYGGRCLPPWSERELQHKLADAFQRTQPRLEFAPRSAQGRAFSPRPLSPPSPAVPASPAASRRGELGAGGRPVARDVLPDLDAGTPAQIAALAALRGLSAAGVALAVARGLVRFGRWWGKDAWFVLDATAGGVGARRLDGRRWSSGNKNTMLRGTSSKRLLGLGEAEGFRRVVLVEGGPDLLAAHHFLIAARELDVAVVVMLTGSCPLPPEALAGLTGRAVTIIPHADAAGQAAGQRWRGQLNQASATVRVLSLAGINRPDGPPIKDLNDLAAAVAAGHPAARERAASLFQP